MRQIFVHARGLCDWQSRLAEPELHWKRGRSAFELAVSWETAAKTERGIPLQLAAALDAEADLCDAKLLLAVPEHTVVLKGLGKASHTDLWALLRNSQGLISMAVEAKAGEPFDALTKDWLKAATSTRSRHNRDTRLDGLRQTLNLSPTIAENLRYQLLHRAASAILEANRFGASQAVLIVQSFSGASVGLSDFQDFGSALGAPVQPGCLARSNAMNGLTLWLGWIDCTPATDKEVAGVVS